METRVVYVRRDMTPRVVEATPPPEYTRLLDTMGPLVTMSRGLDPNGGSDPPPPIPPPPTSRPPPQLPQARPRCAVCFIVVRVFVWVWVCCFELRGDA
jgi:hypothetical protein